MSPSATFQRKLWYLIIQPPHPKKSIKTQFHSFNRRKHCRLPMFFSTNIRGKTTEKPTKTTTTGTSRGKNNTHPRGKNQRTEAYLGKLHGSLLGRDASLLAWHLVLGLSSFDAASAVPWGYFWGAFLVFFGGEGRKFDISTKKSKQPVFDVDNKRGKFSRCQHLGWIHVGVVDGFLLWFTVLDHFFRQRESDVELRSFLTALKHIKPSRLRALHEINMDLWQP